MTDAEPPSAVKTQLVAVGGTHNRSPVTLRNCPHDSGDQHDESGLKPGANAEVNSVLGGLGAEDRVVTQAYVQAVR